MKKISIIIPTYNHGEFIKKAINSVLEQNFYNWEIVIIDDGSTDNTKELMSKITDKRIKYVYQKNSGVASAMNKGFSMSSGEIVAWLDADNYYESGILEKINNYFEKNNNCDVLYGNVTIYSKKKIYGTVKPKRIINKKSIFIYSAGGIPLQPGVFFKKKIFDLNGGFNTKYKIAGDVDFWIKAILYKPNLKFLDENFGYYYVHENGISQGTEGIRRGLTEMIEIFKGHNFPWWSKILLILKYYKNYLSSNMKKYVNIK